jgi:hypothetical protein
VGIEFQWTITLGQVLSTVIVLLIVAIGFGVHTSRAQRRLVALEVEINVLREAVRSLKQLLKVEPDG